MLSLSIACFRDSALADPLRSIYSKETIIDMTPHSNGNTHQQQCTKRTLAVWTVGGSS